jgi:hypothetical protein
MKRKISAILVIICLAIVHIGIAGAHEDYNIIEEEETIQKNNIEFSEDYYVQWAMNFDSDWRYGARYEGPQPIGDCDNDGENELLIGGRDAKLRIYEWDEDKQTYLENHILHCPFYPNVQSDAGGFAIGDVTNDGKNEIGATWSSAIHKWSAGRYKLLGWNSWIFEQGGASADCYIGDCDNDGENEFIVTGGSTHGGPSGIPEVVVFEWNGLWLKKVAEWNDPGVDGYVYMPGLGDVDEDGENEIALGSANKVVVLDWNKEKNKFDPTILEYCHGNDYPFTGICKDSDGDGKDEIHVAYWTPKISIFEWNGNNYEKKFEKYWQDEGSLIEGLDVGDVDDDGAAEVVAGTHLVHILQWNGTSYEEEAVLPTFGELAVVAVGDMDNDGKNEINAGSVMIENGEEYMSWIYKHKDRSKENEVKFVPSDMGPGRLKVVVESISGNELGGGSVGAWSLDTLMWYDLQPEDSVWNSYLRSDLPAGEYLIRAVVEGYEIDETNIEVIASQETTHTFKLSTATTSKQLNMDNSPTQTLLINLFKLIQEKFMNSRILFIIEKILNNNIS